MMNSEEIKLYWVLRDFLEQRRDLDEKVRPFGRFVERRAGGEEAAIKLY